MAFIRVLILFAFVGVALSSLISHINLLPSAPSIVMLKLDEGWQLCPTENVNVTKYGALVKEAQVCADKLSQGNESVCHNLEVNVRKCSQPLVEFFLDCLPEKSKDIPSTVVEGVASIVREFCASTAEVFLQAFQGCIYEYLVQQNKTIKEECKKESFELRVQEFGKNPLKSEYCQIARDLGDCWQHHIDQDCSSLKSKEFFSKFYNAGLSPCKTQ